MRLFLPVQVRLGIVAVGLALFVSIPSRGLTISWHKIVTRDAIEALLSSEPDKDWLHSNMRPWDRQQLEEGAGSADLTEGGLPFTRAPYDPLSHFDNDPDYQSICLNYLAIDQRIERMLESNFTDPYDFGVNVLHAIEDFYSHSNYVFLYTEFAMNRGLGAGAAPPMEEVLANPSQYQAFIESMMTRLHSGFYKDHHFPPADDDHGFSFDPIFGGMNADSILRGGPNIEAREAARKAATWYLRLYSRDPKRIQEWRDLRRACTGVTLKISSEVLVDSLAGQLRTNVDPSVRISNSVLLGEIGNPKSVEPLSNLLSTDPNPIVRRAAAEALSFIGTDSAAEALLRAVDSAQPMDVRADVIKLLGSFPNHRTVEALDHLLGSESSALRAAAVHALALQGDVDQAIRIQPLLRDPELIVAMRAAWALGELRNRASVTALIVSLREAKWPELRAESAYALGRIRKSDAVDAVGSAASDTHEVMSVRLAAVRALGLFEKEKSVIWLKRLLNDKSDRIRASAAYFLIDFKDPTSIQDGKNLLKKNDSRVREIMLAATELWPAPFRTELVQLASNSSVTPKSRLRALNNLDDPSTARSEETRAAIRRMLALNQPIRIQAGAARFLSDRPTADDLRSLREFSNTSGLDPRVRRSLLREVPDVIDLTREEALRKLGDVGMEAGEIREVSFENVRDGIVWIQVPGGGSLRGPGYRVDLYISIGPPPPDGPTVPNLLNLAKDKAMDLLREVGLVGIEAPVIAECEAGDQVVAQIPQAGKQVKSHGTVYFFASNGERIPVPTGLVGRDVSSLGREIDRAVGNRVFYFFRAVGPRGGPSGIVSSQNPEPISGSTVPCGAWIYLSYHPE